jgi:arsenate reductase
MEKPRILFLCTHNSARSQMAEAYLRKHAGDRFQVHSAGIESRGIHPLTIRVMEEAGHSLEGQWSKRLQDHFTDMRIEHLITVCGGAEERCPILPGVDSRAHWPLADPSTFEGSAEERPARSREVRVQTEARVLEWLRQASGGTAAGSAASGEP